MFLKKNNKQLLEWKAEKETGQIGTILTQTKSLT